MVRVWGQVVELEEARRWGENGDGTGRLKASSGTDGSSSAASDWGGRTDGRSSADGNVQSSNNGNKS